MCVIGLLAFGGSLFGSARQNGNLKKKSRVERSSTDEHKEEKAGDIQVPQVQAKVRVQYHMSIADLIVRVDYCRDPRELFERLYDAFMNMLQAYAEMVKIGEKVVPYYLDEQLTVAGVKDLFRGIQKEPVRLIDEF